MQESKGLKYMSALTIVFTVLQVLSGLAVTVIVLLQSGKSAGLSGAISGGADTFLSKGKAKTLDAKLAKATKWFALAFVVLTLILNLIWFCAAAVSAGRCRPQKQRTTISLTSTRTA